MIAPNSTPYYAVTICFGLELQQWRSLAGSHVSEWPTSIILWPERTILIQHAAWSETRHYPFHSACIVSVRYSFWIMDISFHEGLSIFQACSFNWSGRDEFHRTTYTAWRAGLSGDHLTKQERPHPYHNHCYELCKRLRKPQRRFSDLSSSIHHNSKTSS